MSGEAMNKKSIFERFFKADLLRLVNDPVVNVRLSLAKIIRHHFLNQNGGNKSHLILSIGEFVFDIEVNDAVRILKKDKSVDVVDLVEDIKTFPMNEDKDVIIEEFMQRLDNLMQKKESRNEDKIKLEKELHIDDIIEESKVPRKTNLDSQVRTSIYTNDFKNMESDSNE